MDNFSVNHATPSDQPGTRILSLRGSMTIQHGPEIKAALVEALAGGAALLLDLEGVTEIDVIGLQFICSTHRASIAEHKGFSVSKSGNRVVEEAAWEAGFNRHTGCVQDTEHTCIWAGGGKR